MLEKKYLDYRKRILIYVLIFLFMSAFSMLLALVYNLKHSPVFLSVSDLNYMVRSEAATISVTANIGVVSSGRAGKRAFFFPITLPEDADLIKDSVNVFSPLRSGRPAFDGELLKWEGYLPQKGERSVWKITYSYRIALSKVQLPLAKLGTFRIKNTPVTAVFNLDASLRQFSCNYDLRSRKEGFNTVLSFDQEVKKGSAPLVLSW